MKRKQGILYGLGVGPGDPELITLKAARILNSADIIYTAASSKNSHSQAVTIARAHIPDLTTVKMMHFPMTADRDEKEKAWKANALTIIEEVREGKIVAFLTLGDCMTYSTYGYILHTVKALAPELPVISVPGITSYQAAAACLNTPLVEGEEPLLVVSGVNGGDCLRRFAVAPDNVVFMKAYRHVKDIAAALSEAGMLEGSVAVKNCGLPDQEIVRDITTLENDPPTYWTLVLAKKRGGAPPVTK